MNQEQQQVVDLINQSISTKRLEQLEYTVEDILENIECTQSSFCPNRTLSEIFLEEKEYYIQHGMSAFDCGYCNRKLMEIGTPVVWQIGKEHNPIKCEGLFIERLDSETAKVKCTSRNGVGCVITTDVVLNLLKIKNDGKK